MKRRVLIFAATIMGILAIPGCQKSSTGTPFTNSTVKAFFENKCADCHARGGSAANHWTYNNANYESSIKASINSLYQAVYVRRSMPPTGSTNAELDSFKKWYDAGYPAN